MALGWAIIHMALLVANGVDTYIQEKRKPLKRASYQLKILTILVLLTNPSEAQSISATWC